ALPTNAGDRSQDVRSEIQSHYNAAARTFRGVDVAELKAFLSAKLLPKSKDQPDRAVPVGTTDESQSSAPLKRVLRSRTRLRVDSISLTDNEAKVLTILDVSAIVESSDGPNREDSRGAIEDTWVLKNVKWELKETKTSHLEEMARTCRANM